MNLNKCSCGEENKIIYACSGCSDLGELTYKVAKKLNTEGFGEMVCLAGLSAHLDGYVKSAKNATNITIDGCPVACAKKIVEHTDLKPVAFVLTDFGFVKGETGVTDETIEKAFNILKEKLGGNCDGK